MNIRFERWRSALFLSLLLVWFSGYVHALEPDSRGAPEDAGHYVVAAYYFPQWHVDPANVARMKKTWTEWDAIKAATPRFPGHLQPKTPLWGYQMEDDPGVMAQKINAAATHGVGVFIFDWYYHDSGPFLEGALDKGFLQAPNRERINFAIMWANHALAGEPGAVSKATFDKMSDHLVKDYFTNPAYFKVEGKPYFSIFEVDSFVNGMGGAENARAALDGLRKKAMAAGLSGIHLNIVDWQLRNRPDAAKLLQILAADSVTTYTWIHFVPLKALGFPTVDYRVAANWFRTLENKEKAGYGVPYYPNVTMGWDSTPRMPANEPFDGRGYPNMPVITGNTPRQFAEVLENVKADLASAPPSQRIITVDAWNEWGEGAYLEPDTITGMGYLDAIRDVFGVVGAKTVDSGRERLSESMGR
ncbi:MAG: glycoside hydrolase family 99-like domain-containing protein [Methylococcales bacterium]|nr:glycoside hydrolase family 99-like domain-containing protein [Methylococcales bacterium]